MESDFINQTGDLADQPKRSGQFTSGYAK